MTDGRYIVRVTNLTTGKRAQLSRTNNYPAAMDDAERYAKEHVRTTVWDTLGRTRRIYKSDD